MRAEDKQARGGEEDGDRREAPGEGRVDGEAKWGM